MRERPPIGLLQACDDPRLFALKLHPRQRDLLEELERTPNAVWACGRRGARRCCARSSACMTVCFALILMVPLAPGGDSVFGCGCDECGAGEGADPFGEVGR